MTDFLIHDPSTGMARPPKQDEIIIYDVEKDIERPATKHDVEQYRLAAECGGILRIILRKLNTDIAAPIDYKAYLKKLRAINEFIDKMV